MDKFTEYLNKRVMDQAFDIGVLQGTLKSILKYNSSKLPEYVVEDIKRVLKETDKESTGRYTGEIL